MGSRSSPSELPEHLPERQEKKGILSRLIGNIRDRIHDALETINTGIPSHLRGRLPFKKLSEMEDAYQLLLQELQWINFSQGRDHLYDPKMLLTPVGKRLLDLDIQGVFDGRVADGELAMKEAAFREVMRQCGLEHDKEICEFLHDKLSVGELWGDFAEQIRTAP